MGGLTCQPQVRDRQRFWRHVRKQPGGCWLWQLTLDEDGYGRFRLGTKRWYAHVLSHALEIGPIPDDWHVDHKCRNRACVNPDHLEAVTLKVNTLRGEGPTAHNARKTHCVRGHEFTDANTIWKGDRRNCRACRQASRTAGKLAVRGTKRKAKPSVSALNRHRSSGMSWREVGLKYGVSDTAARNWGRQMGIG